MDGFDVPELARAVESLDPNYRHSREGGNPWQGQELAAGLDARLRGHDDFIQAAARSSSRVFMTLRRLRLFCGFGFRRHE
jgi:hypothetical protein